MMKSTEDMSEPNDVANLPSDWKELFERAFDARRLAYAPYSSFAVGSALRTTSGVIHVGCNIENASFGATMCAERVALFKARSTSQDPVSQIAIVADTKDPIPPCGLCRQVMDEIARDAKVLMANTRGHCRLVSVIELLPFSFKL